MTLASVAGLATVLERNVAAVDASTAAASPRARRCSREPFVAERRCPKVSVDLRHKRGVPPSCVQSRIVKGIELPPVTEDFTADPVELFFDLAYVFAFSQLVGLLVLDPTWAGVGKAALLFGLLWLPWQQLTWAANAISGNGRPVRMLFLVATVVSIPMAAATSTAFEGGGPVFALALTGIMVIGFRMQTMGTAGSSDYRQVIYRWITPTLLRSQCSWWVPSTTGRLGFCSGSAPQPSCFGR